MSWKKSAWTVIDFETSGFKTTDGHRAIEIGLAVVIGCEVKHSESILLRPELEVLEPKITEITGITLEMIREQGTPFADVAPRVHAFLQASMVAAAYNSPFDKPFAKAEFERTALELPDIPWLDPMVWVKKFDKYPWRLGEVAARHGVAVPGAHRAGADALMAAQLMILFSNKMPDDLGEALALQEQWRDEQERSYQEWKRKKEAKEKAAAPT